jgi:hypothetical protein
LKNEDLGIGNTIQVGAFKLGTLFSGGVLVYFMDFTTVSSTFLILSVIYFFCLLLLFTSIFRIDHSFSNSSNESNQSFTLTFKERFLMLHKSPGTYWICLFVLIYKLGKLNFFLY